MIKNKLFLCLLATMVAIFSVCIMQAGTVQTIRTTKSSVKTEPDGKKKKKTANKSDYGTTVTLITTGTGSTKEEATKNALRDALEQTYGTFVSANTLVINDKLIKDEIVSISSGNIVKYEVVSFIDSKPMIVTVEAVVSISNLITYAQNKGMEAELAGSTFAMNMRLEELNRESQRKAIENLIQQAKLMSKNLFDYEIKIGEPERVGNTNEAVVGIDILVKPNPNALSLYDLIHSTLGKLSQMVVVDTSNNWERSRGYGDYPQIRFVGSWIERVRSGNGPFHNIGKSKYTCYILKVGKEPSADPAVLRGFELSEDDKYWRDVNYRLEPDFLDLDSRLGFEIIDNLGKVYSYFYNNLYNKNLAYLRNAKKYEGYNRSKKFYIANNVNMPFLLSPELKELAVKEYCANWLGLPKNVLETKDLELYKFHFQLHYTMDEISKIKKIEVRPKNPL